MPLQFYEKVEVLACPGFPHRVGKFGHVLGKQYVDDDPERGEVCGYGVFFEDLGEVYSFAPSEIRGTGEIAERSDFYDGVPVRVREENGKGFPVEE